MMNWTGPFEASPVDAVMRPGDVRVCVLATTDLHAHLYPFNYYTDRRDDAVGLAGIAALVGQLRSKCPNSLLFDNGDTLQGAPLGDAVAAGLLPEGQPHPMIAAMNALRYDAATLGNHDFDFGLDQLRTALSAARYPVVVANADEVGRDRSFLPRHTILDRDFMDTMGRSHRLRIGVTGVTPPHVAQWARAHLDGRLALGPMVPAVKRAVRALRRDGADLVVVLAHSGLGTVDAPPDAENAAVAIARIDGVDAVVAGHSHSVYPDGTPPLAPGEGAAPVVQPGYHGSHLGRIDIVLRKTPDAPDAKWAVVARSSRVHAPSDTLTGERAAQRRRLRRLPGVRDQLARGHRLTRAYAARALGRTAVPLETYFSLRAPCAATSLIADAQRTAMRAVIDSDPELAALPLLSATTPFKAGGRGGPTYFTDIAPGALLLRHAADLYPYTNGLSLLLATGRQVRAWLERSAAAFRRITPNEAGPQPLLDRQFASYNFDHLDGLTYQIDLSHPALTNAEGDIMQDTPGRICNLRRADGAPVRDDDRFLVATNSYRAAGGGHHPAAAGCAPVFTTADPVRDRLVDHIVAQPGPIAPTVRPGWSFAPMGGVEVLFETGPGARAHAAQAAALGLAERGTDAEGFVQYLMKI